MRQNINPLTTKVPHQVETSQLTGFYMMGNISVIGLKTGPSKTSGIQLLFQQTISLQIFERLYSTNFTWSIFENFFPNVLLSFFPEINSYLVGNTLRELKIKKRKMPINVDLCSFFLTFDISYLLDNLTNNRVNQKISRISQNVTA